MMIKFIMIILLSAIHQKEKRKRKSISLTIQSLVSKYHYLTIKNLLKKYPATSILKLMILIKILQQSFIALIKLL